MTDYSGRDKYLVGEFGIESTLVVAVLAVYFGMRRAEVDQPYRLVESPRSPVSASPI